MSDTPRPSPVPGLALGALLGTVVGGLEATLAYAADPSWGGAVFGAGPLIDAVIGGIVGGGVGRVMRVPSPAPAPVLGVLALLGIGGGFTLGGRLAPATPPAPAPVAPTTAAEAPVVWVLVDGLRADLDLSTLPTLSALQADGASYSQVWSPSPDAATALASLWSGRLPSTHGADATHPLDPETPTRAPAILGLAGVPTTVVSAVGPTAFPGAQSWRRARPARPLGTDPTTARLLALRLLALGHAAPLAPADAVVEEALAWLDDERPEDPWVLVVHLSDPERASLAPGPEASSAHAEAVGRVDTALATLKRGVDAVAPEATWVVQGTTGAALTEAERDQPLGPAALHVPVIARLPDGLGAGRTYPETALALDGLSTVAEAVQGKRDHLLDGRSLFGPPQAETGQQAVVERMLRAARQLGAQAQEALSMDDLEAARKALQVDASGIRALSPEGDDPCDVLYPAFGTRWAVSRSAGRRARYVLRGRGHAAVIDGDPRQGEAPVVAVYDRARDPSESTPMAPDAETCLDDAPDAEAVGVALREALLETLQASGARTEEPFPDLDPERGRDFDMPDPKGGTP